MNRFRGNIHRHVFRPSQDSLVWLALTRREYVMSPECTKHQVLSFTKMLVVWRPSQNYSVLISVLQTAQWRNSKRISREMWFVLPWTHQCGSGWWVEKNWCHRSAQSTRCSALSKCLWFGKRTKKYAVLISVLQSAQWVNSDVYLETRISLFPGLISVAQANG